MEAIEKSRKQGWERRIWGAVIDYVNTATPAHQRQPFEKLVNMTLDWISGDESDMEGCRDLERTPLDALANQYRPELANVLTWLSDPAKHRGFAGQAVEFLRKFSSAIRVHIDGNAGFKNADDPLVFEWPDEIGSVITPLCKFILDQIQRHDINGEPLRDVVPIGQCERAGCNQFFVIERVGRTRFCSGLCRAKVNQSLLPKEVRAERMRKYRQGLKARAAAKQRTKRGSK